MKTTIAAVLIMMAGLTASAQTNLVQNGGFKQGDIKSSIKEATAPSDWYSGINTKVIPQGKISFTTEENYKGKKSVKMSIDACEVKARYNMILGQKMEMKDVKKLTMSFYAKSADDIKLSVFMLGSQLESGKGSSGYGSTVNIEGNGKWAKYTVKVNLKPMANTTWDFAKPTSIAIGFDLQIIESEKVIYLDEVELI